MRNTKSISVFLALAFAVGSVAVSVDAQTQKPGQAGPPACVIEAWESGEAPILPDDGPPARVVEAWLNGERPVRPMGPPAWVRERHEMARELGLPGPPPEVIEAWKNGEGFHLPGPPDYVLDLLGL